MEAVQFPGNKNLTLMPEYSFFHQLTIHMDSNWLPMDRRCNLLSMDSIEIGCVILDLTYHLVKFGTNLNTLIFYFWGAKFSNFDTFGGQDVYKSLNK